MDRSFPDALRTRPVPDDPAPTVAGTDRSRGGVQAPVTAARARIASNGAPRDGARHRREGAEK